MTEDNKDEVLFKVPYPNTVIEGIPPDTPDLAPHNPIDIVICAFHKCAEQNVQRCRKCNRPFCIMHANRFSPNFCMECFANLAPMEGKFQRIFEHYSEDTDEVIITKESCTKYYMDGPDWPFLTAYIDTLSDDELKAVWNFHFFVMKHIEAENETRKIEKNRKLRDKKTPTLITQTQTVTKKVTMKSPDTAEELRKKFKKQGLPDLVIEQMIAVMTKGN